MADRMRRLLSQFEETGMRRSVDAVIVCHVRKEWRCLPSLITDVQDHGVPCVLTLQIANDFFKL